MIEILNWGVAHPVFWFGHFAAILFIVAVARGDRP